MSEPPPSPLWPADNPAVTAHVSMIQGIINRLAGNSASCKTWCLALVSALLSLAGASHVPAIVTFALLPVVVFGFLDAMYLAQERAYRALFDEVVGMIRMGTYTRQDAFRADAPMGSFFAALTSWSVYPVYIGLLLAYTVAAWRGWLDLLAAVVSK